MTLSIPIAPATPSPASSPPTRPIAARPLEPAKREMLQRDLVLLASKAQVRDEARWQEFVNAYKTLVTSTVNLLEDSQPIVHVFHRAMDAEGCAYIPHLTKDQLHAENLDSIWSITGNRRDDAYNALAVLNDPAFLQQTFQGMMTGALKPDAAIPPLSEARLQELSETILPPGKYEPAAHIAQTAQGHQRGHAILAKVFNPEGLAGQRFIETVQKATPEVNPALAKVFAERWLQTRSTRAQQVADALRPDSPLVTAAKEESERRRLAKGQPVNVPATARIEVPVPPAASHALKAILGHGPKTPMDHAEEVPGVDGGLVR